jgi:hypothetical protein
MAENKRNWLKEILEWLHHAYWIHEFLVSSGLAAGAMTWLGSNFPAFKPYRWPTGLFAAGILMYVLSFIRHIRPAKKPKQGAVTIALDQAEQEIGEAVDDAKRSGAQAGMLWMLAASAKDLIQMLEQTWHHWNNAGERLIHPLDARLDKLDFSKDGAASLANERRDFMVLYSAHLTRLQADLRGFSSDVTKNGYPNSREYVQVLNDLRAHAQKLDEEADRIWKAEKPEETLHQPQPQSR